MPNVPYIIRFLVGGMRVGLGFLYVLYYSVFGMLVDMLNEPLVWFAVGGVRFGDGKRFGFFACP